MRLSVQVWEDERLDAAPAASGPTLRAALTELGFRRTGVVRWSGAGFGRVPDPGGPPIVEEVWLHPSGSAYATVVDDGALALITRIADGTLVVTGDRQDADVRAATREGRGARRHAHVLPEGRPAPPGDR